MRRPWLLPLSPLYAAALWSKRHFEPHPRHLQQPVISIGSLSAGGAGKTPVVLALAGLLHRAGYPIDVLSRGYGRTKATTERVDPHGTADAFGDEPLLLARAGLPVWVGANRYQSGTLAESTSSEPTIHLLDDGFQHRQLARSLDIVLLTKVDANDHLLPGGNLREPLSRLRQAGAVVVREEEAESLGPVLNKFASNRPVWRVRRQIETVAQRRIIAFCGIARPEGFFSMLAAHGAELAKTVSFNDHHRFRPRDIDRLITLARDSGAIGFVTTEKDVVRLSAAMREQLEAVGTLQSARLTLTFLDEEAVLRQVIAAIGA